MTDFETSDRDVNRAIRSWLHTDRHEDASRIAGAVLDQVSATPRRRAGWPAWRTPIMNKFAIGLGAVAVVVVGLFLGYRLLGSPTNVGGPGDPTATPEATATPDASVPDATATPDAPTGLPEGPHVLTDGEVIDGIPTLRTVVTIPARGWEPGNGWIIKGVEDEPGFAGLILGFGDTYVYGDPCAWSTTRPDVPATTVDEVVAALGAQASRDASEPVDVTLDGYAGKAITLHVPDDAVFSECDQGEFSTWGHGADELGPWRYQQDPGQIDEVWVLDVDGELAIVDWTYFEVTPQADIDELRAIVDSISFEAP